MMRVYYSQILPFLYIAVHAMFSFLVSFFFLSLSISLHPICLRDAITYKGKEKERE